MYAFGFQLFNQYCIKQLFYQTGRSTCTRSLPAGLYLSLFHNRSAGVRIPDISEHRVGLDLRSRTCSPVLSLRIRCTNCCAAIYNTGEYRIPVLPGTDLCSDFFLHLPACEAHGDGISRGHFHSCRSFYRYRCQKYGNGINHRKIRCRSYIQKIAENPLSCPDMLPLLKIQ